MLVTIGTRTINLDHVVKIEPIPGKPGSLALLTTTGGYETFTGDEAARLGLVLGVYAVDCNHARTVGEAIEAEQLGERRPHEGAEVGESAAAVRARAAAEADAADAADRLRRLGGAVPGLVHPAATIAAYQAFAAAVVATIDLPTPNGRLEAAVRQLNRDLACGLSA
jgi:hypothetical protein